MMTVSRVGAVTRIVVPGQTFATALAWATPPLGLLGIPLVIHGFVGGQIFVPICQLFFFALCFLPLVRPVATSIDADRAAGTLTFTSRYAYRPAKAQTFPIADLREIAVSGNANVGWVGVYGAFGDGRRAVIGGEIANVAGARAEALRRYEALREATGAPLPALQNLEAARV